MHPQQFITFLAIASNGYLVVASPIPQLEALLGGFLGGGATITQAAAAGRGRQPSTQAINTAQKSWQRDTGTVSKFLSNAESMSPQQLQRQARIALNAENDELTHKGVLDQMFLSGSRRNRDSSVRQANNVLETQGTFQFVVDGLQTLSTKGARMTPKQVSRMILAINEDRCPQVLPAIDTYMAAAEGVVQSGNNLRAIRPSNC